jgi:hypothetical protein
MHEGMAGLLRDKNQKARPAAIAGRRWSTAWWG